MNIGSTNTFELEDSPEIASRHQSQTYESHDEVNLSSSSSDLYPSVPSSPRRRESEKPAILVSARDKRLGPLVTCLDAIPLVHNIFINNGKDYVEDLGYSPRWWLGTGGRNLETAQGPQSSKMNIAVELQRLSAFLGMSGGRAAASVRFLESNIAEEYLDDCDRILHTFAEATNSIEVFQMRIQSSPNTDTQTGLSAHVSSPRSDHKCDLNGCLSVLFYGSDYRSRAALLEPPPAVFCFECSSTVELSEYIWPQRFSTQFTPYLDRMLDIVSKNKEKLAELQSMRLKTKSFQGKDVLQILQYSKAIMEEAGELDTAEDLDFLSEQAQLKNNNLLERIKTIQRESEELELGMQQLNDAFFEKLDMPPCERCPYECVAAIYEDDYFYKNRQKWYKVSDNRVRRARFTDFQFLMEDCIVLYASRKALDEVPCTPEASSAVSRFCEADRNHLQLELDEESSISDVDLNEKHDSDVSE